MLKEKRTGISVILVFWMGSLFGIVNANMIGTENICHGAQKKAVDLLVNTAGLIVEDYPDLAIKCIENAVKSECNDMARMRLRLKLCSIYEQNCCFQSAWTNIAMINYQSLSLQEQREYWLRKGSIALNLRNVDASLSALNSMPEGVEGFIVPQQIEYAEILGRICFYHKRMDWQQAEYFITDLLNARKYPLSLVFVSLIANSVNKVDPMSLDQFCHQAGTEDYRIFAKFFYLKSLCNDKRYSEEAWKFSKQQQKEFQTLTGIKAYEATAMQLLSAISVGDYNLLESIGLTYLKQASSRRLSCEIMLIMARGFELARDIRHIKYCREIVRNRDVASRNSLNYATSILAKE